MFKKRTYALTLDNSNRCVSDYRKGRLSGVIAAVTGNLYNKRFVIAHTVYYEEVTFRFEATKHQMEKIVKFVELYYDGYRIEENF